MFFFSLINNLPLQLERQDQDQDPDPDQLGENNTKISNSPEFRSGGDPLVEMLRCSSSLR
jgi:hypothetical protein